MPIGQLEPISRMSAVEEIITPQCYPPGQAIVADRPADQVVHGGAGMGVRADLDADRTVRTLHAPKVVATLLIALPFFHASVDRFVAGFDGLGGAVCRALLAEAAKVLHAEMDRPVLGER